MKSEFLAQLTQLLRTRTGGQESGLWSSSLATVHFQASRHFDEGKKTHTRRDNQPGYHCEQETLSLQVTILDLIAATHSM